MLSLGDTFRERPPAGTPRDGFNPHVYVVVSDPAKDGDRIVTVNFTSWKSGRPGQDESCVVEEGEHSFIRVRTLVNYRDAREFSTEQFRQATGLGYVELGDPVSAALLQRILAGAAASRFFPKGLRCLLLEQGLIAK